MSLNKPWIRFHDDYEYVVGMFLPRKVHVLIQTTSLFSAAAALLLNVLDITVCNVHFTMYLFSSISWGFMQVAFGCKLYIFRFL